MRFYIWRDVSFFMMLISVWGVLLSCMVYVDLNPIRAAMEKSLEESDFTSIQQRLFDYSKCKANKSIAEARVAKRIKHQRELKKELGLAKQSEAPLMVFDGRSHTNIHSALPFTREDYFQLVEATGRIIRDDKRGYIAADIPSIVSTFGIKPDRWIDHVKHFSRRYTYCAGSRDNIIHYAAIFERGGGKGKGLAVKAISCGNRLDLARARLRRSHIDLIRGSLDLSEVS